MRVFTASVILALLSTVVMAQDKLSPRVVRVVGKAEVKVVPDRVVIEIGVEKQNPRAAIAKASADGAARKLIAAIREAGVEEKDIQTTSLSLRPQYDYRAGMKISYFVAEQFLTVTLRDINNLDSLLDAVIKAGANRIDSIQYETSDLRKYRDQARAEAVKAAREKAQALAQTLGQEIGKAYSIEEIPEQNYEWGGGLMSNREIDDRMASPAKPTTAPGERKVSASVTVSFDLN
jgi:uncharacterized protein YggE